MKKYLFIVAIFTICQLNLFAQNAEGAKRDSLLIVSLQKRLPTLRDTARINCLNELGKAFLYRRGYDLKTKSDSAYPYAAMANSEATQLNYNYGIAYSLVNLCYTCYFNVSTSPRPGIEFTANLNKWETYQKQLLGLAREINDPELLGQTYYPLYSVLLSIQNKPMEGMSAAETALTWYKKSGNEQKECEAYQSTGYQYFIDGEYEKAFDYFNSSLQLAKKNNLMADRDHWSNQMIQWGLTNMSDIYKTAGDYETALNFLRESRQFHAAHNASNTWGGEAELADVFLKSAQYDSAFYYLKPLFTNDNSAVKFQWPILAEAYFLTGKYDSAMKYYDRAIDTFQIRVAVGKDPTTLVRCYNGKAKVLAMKHDYKEALGYSKKSYTYARQTGNKSNILESYELLSQCYHQLGENDSAYFYLQKYMLLKDSIITRQFLWRLNNYKKEAGEAKKVAQIGFLSRDNKIKTEQLKQQSQQKNFLLLGLVSLFFIGFFIFRWLIVKRKNEKLTNEKIQTALQQRTVELEMQALRAQMNPHFIFNCLNAINRFIFINESKAASDYLTRFSRLIRMVLLNSQKKLVALEDELEMLRLYLDMERMRFKNAFDYHITTTNAVESLPIFVPPLLLQPFCENAIWHGLMHLPDRQAGSDATGHLNIELYEEQNILHCIITDNGVGREQAATFKSKSAEKDKSLGLTITRERLSLLNQGTTGGTFYEIEDLTDEQGNAAGTRVKLQIYYKEAVEEMV